MSRLRPLDARLLTHLATRSGPVSVDELAAALGSDQSPIAGALTTLASCGWVRVDEEIEIEWKAGPKAATWRDGAPERQVARVLYTLGGRAEIKTLGNQPGLDTKAVGEALRWLTARGWASKEGSELVLDPSFRPDTTVQPDEQLVAALADRVARLEELTARGVLAEEGLTLLSARPGVVEKRERKRRLAALTTEGRQRVAAGFDVAEEINELTTELLVSGRWREMALRAYDVTLPGPKVTVGKEHPFRRLLEETRRVYLEMGFDEISSPWVESAFWDFDALFQPQDHPARDLQDTFYVKRPARARLPGAALVTAVQQTHENGGASGSLGWRYRWNEELAQQTVLRTHTTSATIQALAAAPHGPRKLFCVGPVFRREAIDFKHLPVFHQVDGIVVDERATFAGLLALVRTFYRKMGFDRVQFRPDFFPYTEPSLGVHVWFESRGAWLEMGGAGIFRPEVTTPLGCPMPVLAWGLGLERIAMLRYGLTDIRELFLAHLGWLEETPLCRS